MAENKRKSEKNACVDIIVDDIIKTVEKPQYGSIIVYFQNGKITLIERKETIK